MKRFLLLMFVAIATLTVNAQDWYMAGSASLWRNDDANRTSFTIAPELGCNLDESWAIGSEFVYDYNYIKGLKTNSFAVAPYFRYSFYNNRNVRLFLDGGFGFSTTKIKGIDDTTDGYQIGIKPGIAVKLNDHFSIIAKAGFLGYKDDYLYTREDNGFGFRLDGEDLSFGIHYEF